MRRWTLTLALGGLLAATAGAQGIIDRVREVVLDNGMTFLLLNRGEAPVFSSVIRWNVGSVDEPMGLTGIAHMFEHMAFKGTTTVGTTGWDAERPALEALNAAGVALVRAQQDSAEAEEIARLRAEYDRLVEEHRQFVVSNELDEIYSAAGAEDLNAGTERDFTTYYVSLPANQLELWCLIEAGRIRDGVLREFYAERDVVHEERRMRYDTDPEGFLVEQFLGTAFIAHPYRFPTIGWATDIMNLTTEDAEEFFREHYAPVNACGALVGNFDLDEAERLIREHFSPIPAGERNRRVNTVEPAQRGERRVEVHWDASPIVLVGYHKPSAPDRVDAVFDVIQTLLTSGRSSRLYERMVKRDQIATDVEAFTFPGNKYPNLSTFYIQPRAPHTSADAERVLYEELERLASEPVTERELQRAINILVAAHVRGMASNMSLARDLTFWHFIGGDWRWTDRWYDLVRGVTAEDIMEAARTHYRRENRTVGVIVPRESAAATASPEVTP